MDTPLPAEPRTKAAFVPCPVCDGRMRVTLVDDWQETGIAIPIVDCGNPWHYTNVERGAAAPEPRPDLREALERLVEHFEWYAPKNDEATDVLEQARAALAATPPAPDCRDGHDMRLTTDFDGEPFRCSRCRATPPAQPLPTEPDWGRMAYVLGLIGPVDTDDTEDAFVAYAEDIRAHYRRSDLETDSQYAAYVSRLSEARDAAT